MRTEQEIKEKLLKYEKQQFSFLKNVGKECYGYKKLDNKIRILNWVLNSDNSNKIGG